jgi:5-amino-6-(5-phosphoribosylamino)uracil reductase
MTPAYTVFVTGPEGNDLSGVLNRIGAAFGTNRLLLESGGEINGAFAAEDLIDETNTPVYPVLEGRRGIPATYDHRSETNVRAPKLISSEVLKGDAVWLRHRMIRTWALAVHECVEC